MALTFHLIAVGRMRAGVERQLFDHYAGRIAPALQVREVEEKKSLPVPQLKAREAELLLQAIPAGAAIVALDERGKTMSSPDFARKIGQWRDEGIADLAFVIGGADGLDGAVRKKANMVLSFGTATWPHMMVRGMIAEQIYRAQCILSGHPYHRA